MVEIEWPATQTTSPATDTTPRRLKLYSSRNHVARTSRDGALWMEDAHQVDGRWVVPGAVAVFTSRGDRVLSVEPALDGMNGFLVPLPAWPKKAQLAWSEWMPRAREGAAPLPDGFRMRFKVLPRSQPVRVQTFGPWEIATVADGFYDYTSRRAPSALAAIARFLDSLQGHAGHDRLEERLTRPDVGCASTAFESVALLPGAPDALLVHAATEDESGPLYLLVGDGEQGEAASTWRRASRSTRATLLTNDVAEFKRAQATEIVPGTIDRTTFARAGRVPLSGIGACRRSPPRCTTSQPTSNATIDLNVPPLGVSPDGHRFVRVGWNEENDARAHRDRRDVGGANARPDRPGADAVLQGGTARSGVAGALLDVDARQQRGVRARAAKRCDAAAVEGAVDPAGALQRPSIRSVRRENAMFEAMASFLTTEMGATRTPEDRSRVRLAGAPERNGPPSLRQHQRAPRHHLPRSGRGHESARNDRGAVRRGAGDGEVRCAVHDGCGAVVGSHAEWRSLH